MIPAHSSLATRSWGSSSPTPSPPSIPPASASSSISPSNAAAPHDPTSSSASAASTAATHPPSPSAPPSASTTSRAPPSESPSPDSPPPKPRYAHKTGPTSVAPSEVKGQTGPT